jgi:FlaA1/EpsC-like NDP-sugar epimerase
MIGRLNKKLLRIRNNHFLILDILICLIAPLLALCLRLDGSLNFAPFQPGLMLAILLFLGTKLLVFHKFGIYQHYWRYAGVDELTHVGVSVLAATIVQSLVFSSLYYLVETPLDSVPRSLPLLDGMISLILIGTARFSLRAIERWQPNITSVETSGNRTLIVGAGSAGASLVQEMLRTPSFDAQPIAFIDDDPVKMNLRIRGIPVVANRHHLPEVVRRRGIDWVIIAMPTAPGAVIREIAETCKTIGVKVSTLPGTHEILSGRVRFGAVRDIKIEDLLRREPIQTDTKKVRELLKDKRVLVTGAGGSIGSELCRQIFKGQPAELILLGHGENSVFNIQQELEQVLKELQETGETEGQYKPRLIPFIADLRFPDRLEQAFSQYKPEIVFHAAAHKHVPLMEFNPPEAITNNVLGTKNLLDQALRHNVPRFVMISTDKAVNPTSVMGASKRCAEMLVLKAAQLSGKAYTVVRFGNVLGSRGSVVHTFRRQIAAGGPVTVTHPEMCRYFMTIPEAVQLVLQASVINQGGEIFMLNMGEPVKIVDLAKDLIRLSGYEVGKDIEIQFSGLRPGEKLFEELLIPGEEYEPTLHHKLMVVKNALGFIPDNLNSTLKVLRKAAQENNANLILFLLEQLIPGFTPKYSDVKQAASQKREPTLKLSQGRRISRSHSRKSRNALSFEPDLKKALQKQEFTFHYQPIFDLDTLHVRGFEALLRWQHPELGLISPPQFLSIAEVQGLMPLIHQQTIQIAGQQLQAWQTEFPDQPLTMCLT